MKILYIDCFLGFSAPMLTGALIDLGADEGEINRRLAAEVPSAVLKVQKTERSMLECTLAEVDTQNCAPDCAAKNALAVKALKVYRKFCGEPTEDKILQIASQAVCISAACELLGVEFVMCSSVSVGTLTEETEASVEIFKAYGITFGNADENCTLTDAQGAAFLAALVSEYGAMPDMDIEKIGYGAGEKKLSSPNLIRAVLGTHNDVPLSEMFESIRQDSVEFALSVD